MWACAWPSRVAGGTPGASELLVGYFNSQSMQDGWNNGSILVRFNTRNIGVAI